MKVVVSYGEEDSVVAILIVIIIIQRRMKRKRKSGREGSRAGPMAEREHAQLTEERELEERTAAVDGAAAHAHAHGPFVRLGQFRAPCPDF